MKPKLEPSVTRNKKIISRLSEEENQQLINTLTLLEKSEITISQSKFIRMGVMKFISEIKKGGLTISMPPMNPQRTHWVPNFL